MEPLKATQTLIMSKDAGAQSKGKTTARTTKSLSPALLCTLVLTFTLQLLLECGLALVIKTNKDTFNAQFKTYYQKHNDGDSKNYIR